MRWRRKDISKLSYYTRNFNTKISSLSKNPAYKDVTLPDYLNYNYVKSLITTRANYNAMITYLQSVNKPTFANIKHIENVKILQGEYRFLEGNRSRLGTYLQSEYDRFFDKAPNSDYTPVQMGNTGYLFYENRLNKINNLYHYTGAKFSEYREQVFRQGNRDWILHRQETFMENYKGVMERYSHFDNYKKWEVIVDFYNKKPAAFYKAMKQDIALIDLQYNSDEVFTEAEFDRFIETFLENAPDADEIRSRF